MGRFRSRLQRTPITDVRMRHRAPQKISQNLLNPSPAKISDRRRTRSSVRQDRGRRLSRCSLCPDCSKEDLDMRTNFDFAPYRRSTVGFDRLFDLFETSARTETENYPPFDIEQQGEDQYRITLAVAGFRPEEIEIVAQNNQLTVKGNRAEEDAAGRS